MNKPLWAVRKEVYAAIESILGSVPIAGGILTPVLKLIFQTHEEKRQENMLTDLVLTQEEYDALETKDNNTRYNIVGAKPNI